MDPIKFTDLDIIPEVLKAITEMGFEVPTEIQAKAIPLLTETDKDFIGQAQTGTGKTAAFAIPLLKKIDFDVKKTQALILAPTRELAQQVEQEIKKLSKYISLKSTCVYGGASYEKQMREIKAGPQIIVGTPGRVKDFVNRGIIKLSTAQFCILDEADEMLNMGFLEDVQFILNKFNEERQLIMFSATMPNGILKLIKKSFDDYQMVKIAKKSLSNDDIEQKYFIVQHKYFKESLARIIDHAPEMYGIIFCRTRLETKDVGDDLRNRGYFIETLNGDMGQGERERSMQKFKSKKVNIMVCTDVAARGIDVTNLTHVINYGLPQDNESYVHRIGRTGRAGQKGKAYTIVCPKTAYVIKKIEKHVNKKIELEKLPSVEDLKQKRIEKEIDSASKIVDVIRTRGDKFVIDSTFDIFEDRMKDLTRNELMKLMFTLQFNKKLLMYDAASDIEGEARAGTGGGGDRGRGRGRRRSNGDRDSKRSSGGRSARGRSGKSGGGRRSGSGGGSSAGGRKRSGKPSSSGGGRRSSRPS